MMPSVRVYSGKSQENKERTTRVYNRVPVWADPIQNQARLQSALIRWHVCFLPVLFLETKLCVPFVFEVYLVDQLVMDLFSIWARRLSGEAVVGMRKGA